MVILRNTMKILFYSLLLAFLASGLSKAAPPNDKFPLIFKYRCSEELRLSVIEKNGGSPALEIAVIKGLKYLQKNQNPDGSWTKEKPIEMTGLALLCF